MASLRQQSAPSTTAASGKSCTQTHRLTPPQTTHHSPLTAPLFELACNLASRTESDLRVPEALIKSQPPAVLAAGWFTRPIWFYLVAAAWLLATVEWFLYQRRWIS